MGKYFFTIIVRYLITISGLAVFVATSFSFGSEGRGLIAYYQSIFFLVCMIFSCNLGQLFLAETLKNKQLKSLLLPSFISLNLRVITFSGLALLSGILFVTLLFESRPDFRFYCFIFLVPHYTWAVNGNSFFTALDKVSQQDCIIATTRIFILILSAVLIFFGPLNLEYFVILYGIILSGGAIFEMLWLSKPKPSKSVKFKIFNKGKWLHLDYLTFNSYPLILTIVSGYWLEDADLGRLNFVIQLISFIFILSVIAGLRSESYIATTGSIKKLTQIRYLVLGSLFLSIFGIFFILLGISSDIFVSKFQSFSELSPYFMLISLSVPGFLVYKLFHPLLVEKNLIKSFSIFKLVILFLTILGTIIAMPIYGFISAIASFAIFYSAVSLGLFVILQMNKSKKPIPTN